MLTLSIVLIGIAVILLDRQHRRASKNLDRLLGHWKMRLETALNNQRRNYDTILQTTGGLWTTGKGDVLAIRDMTDLHIQNALDWMRDNPGRFNENQDILLRHEQERRAYGRRLENEKIRTPRHLQVFRDLLVGDKFELNRVGTCTKTTFFQARDPRGKTFDLELWTPVFRHRGARRLP